MKYTSKLILNGEEYEFAAPQGGLPSIYQAVEYIEGTGTQLIDTGYLVTSTTEVSVDYQFTNAISQDFIFGVGSDNDTSSGMTFCIYCGSVNFKAGVSDGTIGGEGGTWSNYLSAPDTNRHIFELTNGTFSMYDSDGTLEQTTNTSLTFTRTATHSFGLFCRWRFDAYPAARWSNITPAKLYGCKVKDNGVLQRDFVPCYRIADGEIGLYDLVNHNFYTNAGTGTFTKGPDAN